VFCRRRLRLGSAQGGRDGCAEELEGAALDGGGFGQGWDDGAVGAVSDVVAGQCPEVWTVSGLVDRQVESARVSRPEDRIWDRHDVGSPKNTDSTQ